MKPHLVHVFPAFGGGGPEVRTADVINQSADRFRHSIVSLSGELSGRERVTDAAGVSYVSAAGASIRVLSRLLRSCQADLILTYGWGGTDAIAAARLAGIRRIVHTEDGFLDDEVSRQKWKRRWARRLLFKAANVLVVPSLLLCGIARATWRVGTDRLRYIPNGVDIDRFTPANDAQKAAARRELGIPADAVTVGIVGALRPEKNQLRLLQAFADVADVYPNAYLLIVGDGPQMAMLRQASQVRGIARRSLFTGAVGDTTPCYRAMDVLAVSSDTEQMPLSVLEGMASGLPVVSTDVGDVKSMVCEDNRAIVAPRELEGAFADALALLLDDARRRKSLGEANRNRCAQEFNLQQMLRTYFTLYEELANSPELSASLTT